MFNWSQPVAPPNSSVHLAPATAAPSVSQQALERRVDWLAEDLIVVRRRANDIFATTSDGLYGKRNCDGLSSLKDRATQLSTEISEERAWRENLDDTLNNIEATLSQEQGNREKALGTLSVELEETMQSLVQRIDSGLNESTKELASRAVKTEGNLKALIMRVDEGLVVGSRELQEMALGGSSTPGGVARGLQGPTVMSMLRQNQSRDAGLHPSNSLDESPQALARSFMASLPTMPGTPGGAPRTLQLSDLRGGGSLRINAGGNLEDSLTMSGNGGASLNTSARSVGNVDTVLHGGASLNTSVHSVDNVNTMLQSFTKSGTQGAGQKDAAEPLLQVWSDLQEENMRLRQKRAQLEDRQQRSRINSKSPTAPHSRNRSPNGHSSNLGSGFRWRPPGENKGKTDAPRTIRDLSGQEVPTNVFQRSLETASSLKDSDAVSTTSSLPTSASVQNQNQGTASQDVSAGWRSRRIVDTLGNSTKALGPKAPSLKQPELRTLTAPNVRQSSPPASRVPSRNSSGAQVPYSPGVHARPGAGAGAAVVRPARGGGRGGGGGYSATATAPRLLQVGQQSPGAISTTPGLRPYVGGAKAN